MDHVSAALSEGLYPTESRTYAPLLKSRTEMYSVATISNNNGYYKPLDPVKHDIRLLVLWPEQYWNGDEPRCCLVHTSLTSEKPMYDALSYCWGDRSETRFVKMELTKDQYYSHDSTSVFDQYTSQYQPDEDFIFLNINQSERLRIWFDRLPDKGKFVTNFRVTINLYNALKHHRPSKLRLFWVDAICINQDDKLERSHQVGYMREIYKSAMNVTVWLGGESGIIWEMQELATSVVEFLRSSESGNITMDEIFRSQQISTLSQDYVKFAFENGPVTETLMKYYKKFSDFFGNPWFRRIWVLQEIRVSQRQVIRQNLYGALWEAITVVGEFINNISNFHTIANHTSYHLDVWNEIVYQKAPASLLALIFGTREFGATDPRDKLVALLGIAAETAHLDKLPTELGEPYVKTETDFFTDFTSWWIDLKRSLAVLSAVCHSKQNDMSKGLILDKPPTWVPDYHKQIPPAGMTIGFPAIYRVSDDKPIRRYDTNNKRILRLEGVEVGRISRLIASEFSIMSTGRYPGSDHVLTAKFDDGFEFGGNRGVLPVLPTLRQRLQRVGDNALTEAVFRTLTCCISTSVSKDAVKLRMQPRVIMSKEGLRAQFELLWNKFDPGHSEEKTDQFAGLVLPHRDHREDIRARLASLMSCLGRSLFSIAGSYAINLGPEDVLPDDLVVILFGGTVPYVLRESGPSGIDQETKFSENPVYEFIGECYVDEYMDGSYVKNINADQVKIFDIH